MAGSIKPIIKVGAICVLIVIAVIIAIALLIFWHIDYRYRLVECDPAEILTMLEQRVGLHLRGHINDVRAVRTRRPMPREGTVAFKIRFTASAQDIDQLLRPVSERMWEATLRGNDARHFGSSVPRWFTEPIQHGRLLVGRGTLNHIYIDTTDEKKYVLYLDGFYRPNDLQR